MLLFDCKNPPLVLIGSKSTNGKYGIGSEVKVQTCRLHWVDLNKKKHLGPFYFQSEN